MNPYTYCSNNPIRYSDPTGLFELDENMVQGTITEGDTLTSIVDNYNEQTGLDLTVDEVAKYNGISDPDKIYAGDNLNLPVAKWKAKESLNLYGGSARVGETGGSLRAGKANVDFGMDWSGNGGEHYVYEFSAQFDVDVLEEYGFGGDLGLSHTDTNYYALLPLRYSNSDVMRSFTGPFETTGGSKGFAIFGCILGNTTGFDASNQTRAAAWQGQTTGYTAGVGVGTTIWSRSVYGNPRMK